MHYNKVFYIQVGYKISFYLRVRSCLSKKYNLFDWLAVDTGPSTWNVLQIDLHPLSCVTGGSCVKHNYKGELSALKRIRKFSEFAFLVL